MLKLILSLALTGALATAAAAAPGDYDDPGMHYSPPPGWERVPTGPAPDATGQEQGDEAQRPPAAAYVFHRGQNDQRTIVIDIQSYDGTLDSFEHQHESDVRKGADGTFVDKPTKTATANGMPALLLKINSGSDVGHFMQRFEYLMIDGTRSIDVSYSGRQGDFDERDAIAAFASLYVVAYPRHNP